MWPRTQLKRGPIMKFKIQIVVDDEQGQTRIEEVIHLNKNNDLGYCVGLSLQESIQLLKTLQQKIVLSARC